MLKSLLLITSSTIAGLGAFLGTSAGTTGDAYDGTVHQLYQNQFLDHSETLFERADMDKSGTLDVDEYSALMVVQAQLSRLNGFIAVHTDNMVKTVPISQMQLSGDKKDLSRADRTRVDAIARAQFYSAAGTNGQLSWDEYAITAITVFASLDSNQDGVLRARELSAFANQTAFIVLNNA